MSAWSGLVAAGIAISLAFFAVGQPIWEFRMDTTQQHEVWSYGPFSAHHTVFNKTANRTDESRDYPYAQLAATQPAMAKVFVEFGQFFVLGILAAVAGASLSVLSVLKKIRGIFAGVAFLAGCGSMLYATFAIVFTLPAAATSNLPDVSGSGFPEFAGQAANPVANLTSSWGPVLGWGIVIVAGLALAWASSDLWHVWPTKKLAPKPAVAVVPVIKPIRIVPSAPPPPLAPATSVPPEPVIEEVFLIGSNGLLIKHMSRSLMSDKDRDVVGSMISAISSFVREAFSERDGEVHEVSLGEHRFVMCNEAGLVVAVLVTTGETEDIVHRLRHLLAILKDRYGERLASWQGEPIEGIEDELAVLWEPYHLPPPPAA